MSEAASEWGKISSLKFRLTVFILNNKSIRVGQKVVYLNIYTGSLTGFGMSTPFVILKGINCSEIY